ARSLAEESVEIARREGDGFDLAIVLANLGLAAHTQRDHETARPVLEECIKVCREIGDDWLLSLPFRHLGYMELREGNHEKAMELFKEGIRALRNVREKWFVARAVETLAISSAALGNHERSARLFGAGEVLREAVGATVQNFYQPDYDRAAKAVRAALGDETWKAALAEGRTLSTEAVIEYALSEEDILRPPTEEPTNSLTRREREVALLVARGFTNRRIAEEFSISERTVENHVAKILRKLGFRSRARIAAWVAEQRNL
ncbi:MAG: LuxR C-terminal-related transcriptional regulator, partial [Rubrobacteraceae bacterium]